MDIKTLKFLHSMHHPHQGFIVKEEEGEETTELLIRLIRMFLKTSSPENN